jgi:hypothetical protein
MREVFELHRKANLNYRQIAEKLSVFDNKDQTIEDLGTHLNIKAHDDYSAVNTTLRTAISPSAGPIFRPSCARWRDGTMSG